MDFIELWSPAKLNLYLAVSHERRADQYHDLQTIFQAVNLGDFVRIARTQSGLKCECHPPVAPRDRRNLAGLAAERVLTAAGSESGVDIRIDKRIPVGSGMGGGSSNAAAALLGVRELCRLRLTDRELYNLAVGLGADVAFFLRGGTQVGLSRGEVLKPVRIAENVYFVMAATGKGLATKSVYETFDQAPVKPLFSLDEALERLSSAETAARGLFNALQSAVERMQPQVAELRQELEESAGRRAIVSGAGSTVFTVVPTAEEATEAVRVMRDKYQREAHVVRPVSFGVCPRDVAAAGSTSPAHGPAA